MKAIFPALLTLTFSMTAAGGWADTWPGLRGAAGTGVSNESDLPESWSEKQNVAWRVDLSGRANSSPAVTASRVYLTTQSEAGELSVIAVDRKAGKIAWQKQVGSGELSTFGPAKLYAHRHNAATPSPVADQEHVWAFFGTGLLVCLDTSGQLVWQRDLTRQYAPYNVRFGMASSPRLWGKLLYLTCLQKGPSYVLALDKKTGKEIWKVSRRLPAEDDGPDAYSTPVIMQTGDRTELLVSGSDHINAYDPASGKQLWISSGLKIDSVYGRIIASPAVGDGVIVAPSANPLAGGLGHAIAIKSGGSGDVTQSHVLWTYKPYTPDAPSPVCYQGRVYMVRDDGVGSCLDLNSGEVLWRQRISAGPYRASIVAGDGKVYFLHRDGNCTVIQAGDDGKVLSRNKLDDTFFSTPAIADGRIYLRGYKRLYAIGK